MGAGVDGFGVLRSVLGLGCKGVTGRLTLGVEGVGALVTVLFGGGVTLGAALGV